MSRGTAISAPFAFANLLLLPVTYSMIFHRGIPNFSYARGAEDNNVSSSKILESSIITIDAASEINVIVNTSTTVNIEVVEDNYVTMQKTVSDSTITTAQDMSVNISEDGSQVNAEVVADETSWTAGGSSNPGNEELTDLWTPESKETPFPAPLDILVLFSSTMGNSDIEGFDETLWTAGASSNPENEDLTDLWTPESNESFPAPLDILVLFSSTTGTNDIEDNNIGMTTSKIRAEDVEHSLHSGIPDSNETSSLATPLEVFNLRSTTLSTDADEDWNETCATGKMQSPIHITTVTAEYNPEAQPLVFVNYDLATLEASVTPHTIKFDLKPRFPGPQIGIAGGGLIGFYSLNHIHLHWSKSEHSIDLKSYKMEAHLVHFKAPYSNLTQEEVLDEPDGIAVLAVLFVLGTADPSVEDLIANFGYNLTEVDLPNVMPKSFLPDNTDEYFRYRGSLTTPPCSEVVIWTVFPTPKTVTQYQITWLANRKLSEGIPDPDNYRHVQKRNNREIVYMKASYTYNIIPGPPLADPIDPGSTASYSPPSIVLLLTAILCFSLRSS